MPVSKLACLLVGAATAVLAACDSLGDEERTPDRSPVETVEEALTRPPEEPASDRQLDLGWDEECRWIGVDPLEADVDLLEVTDLYLELEPDDLDHLYSRSVRSDDRLAGTFRLAPDGQALPLDPGIRFRGFSARGLPKKSFNVRFPGHVEGLDADRTNLNAMYTDPSQVREHLAMRMFRTLGIPAPRTHYVALHINGVYEGLYLSVQRVDEWLLADHGLPTGGATLVRDRTRQVTGENTSMFSQLEGLVGDRQRLLDEVDERIQARGDADLEALAELVEWTFSDSADDVRYERLTSLVDVEAFVDWFALHVLISDVDAFSDDYWLYRPPDEDGLWSIIPWDKDLSFGSHYVRDEGGVANDLFHLELDAHERVQRVNPFLARILALAPVDALLERRLGHLTQDLSLEWFCAELATTVPAISHLATRSPGPDAFHLHPANHYSDIGAHDLHVAALLDFVQLRWAYLEQVTSPEGASGVARATIDEGDVGSSVLFTDADGWTLARLDVLDVDTPGDTPGEVTIAVDESDRSADVDRIWTMDTGSVRIEGHLSLYYRNNLAFGDWYTATERFEPVAGQDDLAVVLLDDGGSTVLPSVANPYSNRVAAELSLEGELDLILERHDR